MAQAGRRDVARDEPLLEISTDKVDTEVPSPGEGVVAKILVPGGRDGRGRHGARGDRARRRAPAEPRPSPPRRRRSPPRRGGRAPRRRARPPAQAEPPHRAPRAAAPAPLSARRGAGRRGPTPADGNGRTFVSPVVARIAAEHGVDPAAVPGTGTGGRVTKKDILAYIESGATRRRRAATGRSPGARSRAGSGARARARRRAAAAACAGPPPQPPPPAPAPPPCRRRRPSGAAPAAPPSAAPSPARQRSP